MMFNKEIIKRVWGKALPLLNDDPNRVRKDKCGAWIVFDEYGNRNSQFGWEIDHIIPSSKGGTDEIENLQPLQWENNVAKGDECANICKVTAENEHNRIAPFWDILLE